MARLEEGCEGCLAPHVYEQQLRALPERPVLRVGDAVRRLAADMRFEPARGRAVEPDHRVVEMQVDI